MSIAELTIIFEKVGIALWGWPLIGFIATAGLIMTCAFNFVQVRKFTTAWKYLFSPEKGACNATYITPMQAFVNTLSASIGNGSLAGMATAIAVGGPGAAFWILVMGFLGMAIRFAEVFAGTQFTEKLGNGVMRGGPMAYLKQVPGGSFLPYAYAFFCLMLTFVTGNSMQCNSIRVGLVSMTGANMYVVAAILFIFFIYVMQGGAERIMRVSDKIIPVKVGVFFLATIIVLVHHYAAIWGALGIIMRAAFTTYAVSGGALGYTMQQAIRYGMSYSLNATEAGLGTSAILFGSTASKSPIRSGIMGLASTFISNYLVCFMLMLVFVATGVWDNGSIGLAMTIAAYETTFGVFGGWLITFLSITFGLGCAISYAYIGRECWMFLSNGKYLNVYAALYCLMALFGAISQVAIVWSLINIINAGLLIVNLYGLLALTPRIRKSLREYYAHNS